MKRKLRVAILFGGKSAEHEISLQSAKNIVEAVDKKKYRIVLIGIDKKGRWFLSEESKSLESMKISRGQNLALAPGRRRNPLAKLSDLKTIGAIDVVFPVLHGPFGEDGTVQGLLKLVDLPFVGAGVAGSAIGMDKDVMKRLLRDAGIRTARFLVCNRSSQAGIKFEDITRRLGLPFFIKPANLGSSVGINKVTDRKEFAGAVLKAFQYDEKILLEEFIEGREIECSVLGNDRPVASLPGEIITGYKFYSYEAKYLDAKGARLEVPAKLPEPVIREIQDLSIRTFQTLCCEGMARVDFFLRGESEVIVNEINTIPGFTRISMYPKLWEASGISYPKLIDRLIQLALERFAKESKLKSSI